MATDNHTKNDSSTQGVNKASNPITLADLERGDIFTLRFARDRRVGFAPHLTSIPAPRLAWLADNGLLECYHTTYPGGHTRVRYRATEAGNALADASESGVAE